MSDRMQYNLFWSGINRMYLSEALDCASFFHRCSWMYMWHWEILKIRHSHPTSAAPVAGSSDYIKGAALYRPGSRTKAPEDCTWGTSDMLIASKCCIFCGKHTSLSARNNGHVVVDVKIMHNYCVCPMKLKFQHDRGSSISGIHWKA